jgi:hypothetical protein
VQAIHDRADASAEVTEANECTRRLKVAVACDHAGIAFKDLVLAPPWRNGYEGMDLGPAPDEAVDRPLSFVRRQSLWDVAMPSALSERGVVSGGSGNSEAIVDTGIPHVRCALCWKWRLVVQRQLTTTRTCCRSGSDSCRPIWRS